jgi:MFS family permease
MDRVSGNQVAWAGMLALAVAMGIGRFAFTPLLPLMQDNYGLTVADGTWLATANYLGYLAGALVALAVPVPAAAAIVGGLTAIGLATLGMGYTHDYSLWLALRAVAGVASAWVMIYISSWSLERLAAAGNPALNGRIFAGVGLGIAGAGLASLAMMHWQWSAAAAWIALGTGSLIVGAFVMPAFLTPTPATLRVAASAPRKPTRWTGESLRLVGCFATSGFGYIIPATFLPAMAKQVIHDPSIFGWSWPVFGAAALVSTLAVGAFRSVGNRRLWAISQLLMAAGVALPALWHEMTAIILAGLLVGGTFMVITMAAIQEARAVAGPRPVGLLSAMTAAFAIGQLLGPLSARLLLNSGGGLASALLIASGVLVTGAYALNGRPLACRGIDTRQDWKSL